MTWDGPERRTGVLTQEQQLELVAERAAEIGAEKAFERLGISPKDEHAARDIGELRDLLRSWREVKSTATKSVVRMFVTILLISMLIGLGAKLKWIEMVKGG